MNDSSDFTVSVRPDCKLLNLTPGENDHSFDGGTEKKELSAAFQIDAQCSVFHALQMSLPKDHRDREGSLKAHPWLKT